MHAFGILCCAYDLRRRLKMGVCEGPPRSIQPDYNGRADYLGDSVNQAARFMDAGGGTWPGGLTLSEGGVPRSPDGGRMGVGG